MGRPRPTDEDIAKRQVRAEEMKKFMNENLFTEVKLAESLGISRRSVQMIKAGKVTPTPPTLRKWEALLKRYGSAPKTPSLLPEIS